MSRTLKKSPNDNIGPRLKKLRTERNLSLSKVAKQLAPHVELQLAGKSGETRISAIENSGANLTLELAIAYSKVFDVSLEYIFCISNDMQHENKTIKETLGLEDFAIAKIKDFSVTQLQILNFLIRSDFIKGLIESFDSFVYTTRSFCESEIVGFDNRLADDKQKEDAKIVELIPRWRLEKSISALIEKIADPIINSDAIDITMTQSSPAIPQ
jgi:transcriptional regulator with XRE-family HTH domain